MPTPTTTYVHVHEYRETVVYRIPAEITVGAGLAVVLVAAILFIWLRRRARP